MVALRDVMSVLADVRLEVRVVLYWVRLATYQLSDSVAVARFASA